MDHTTPHRPVRYAVCTNLTDAQRRATRELTSLIRQAQSLLAEVEVGQLTAVNSPAGNLIRTAGDAAIACGELAALRQIAPIADSD